MQLLVGGAVCLGLGMLLFWIARPRAGELTPFLRYRYAEVTYSLVVTALLGLGLSGMLAGLGILVGLG